MSLVESKSAENLCNMRWRWVVTCGEDSAPKKNAGEEKNSHGVLRARKVGRVFPSPRANTGMLFSIKFLTSELPVPAPGLEKKVLKSSKEKVRNVGEAKGKGTVVKGKIVEET